MRFNHKITKKIIGAAIELPEVLGTRLLESACQECLLFELKPIGITVKIKILLPIIYKDLKLKHGDNIDLLVENKMVVQLKKFKNSLMFMRLKFSHI
jgi:GxxExxY protein